MGSGYRPPPPDKVGRSDLARIERQRKRSAVLAVAASFLVAFLAVNAMTRFAKSWRVVTVMAMRALGKEPATGSTAPSPAPAPAPVQPGQPVPQPALPSSGESPKPLWSNEGQRFYWVEVESSDAGVAAGPVGASPDAGAPGTPVQGRRAGAASEGALSGVCPYALEPERGEPIESSSMETVGGLRFLGMCGGSYAYELVNRSGAVLNALFTDNQGQSWQILVPSGGVSRIKSRTPLDPGLIGKPAAQASVGSTL